MRVIFFIFLSTFFHFALFSADVNSLEKAQKLFDNGLYYDAGILYDSLILNGLDNKEVLFKSAYIAERLDRKGEAIFYLRKIQKKYGSEEIEARIRKISEEIDSEGVSIVENQPLVDRLIRNKMTIWFSLLLLLLTSSFLLWKFKKRFYQILASIVIAISLCLQLFIAYCLFSQNHSLVIIQKTDFYEAPAFAAAHQSDLISPGSVLEIQEQKDIWYKINYESKEYWIPFFMIKKLD